MTKTTREVAEELGVKAKTLMSWVREGHVEPQSKGTGRQRRLTWRESDVEQARRVRDRNSHDSVLVASVGPDLLSAMKRAKEMRDFKGDGEVIVANTSLGRIFRVDAPMSDVLARISGSFLVVLR